MSNWDSYYLAQCYLVASRSRDLSTKCGAVIVSKDNRVLSQGYNGPIRNSDDTNFPTDRPLKYYYTLHAEENALLAYNGSYQDIQGATIYVTGPPCHKCMRMIIQKGIGRVVYAKGNRAKCSDAADVAASADMAERYRGALEIIELDIRQDIIDTLLRASNYATERLFNIK